MNMRIPKNECGNVLDGLRKAGYVFFRDPVSNEESFVYRLGNDFYPRFHLYLKAEGEAWLFSLHLDQKKPSYAGTSMHNGEYEGEHIERELFRIFPYVKA